MKKLYSALLVGAFAVPASATIVSGTYGGTFTTGSTYVATGDTFSGSFQYDTSASVIGTPNSGWTSYSLVPGSFTLTVDGDTYTNANLEAGFPDRVEVTYDHYAGAAIAFDILQLSGTGSLAGGDFQLIFSYTDDPTASLAQLPMTFPTDFTDFRVGLRNSNDQAYGDFTYSLDDTGGPTTGGPTREVPEPAMLGLFGLGAIGLGLSRRRKA